MEVGLYALILELTCAVGDGENMEVVGEHGNSVEDDVVSPLGASENAEEAVVEVGTGLEEESSLDSPAGDGDEGVRVGYAAKFSSHTL